MTTNLDNLWPNPSSEKQRDYRTRAQLRAAGEWRRSPVIVEIAPRRAGRGGGAVVRPNPARSRGPGRSMSGIRWLLHRP